MTLLSYHHLHEISIQNDQNFVHLKRKKLKGGKPQICDNLMTIFLFRQLGPMLFTSMCWNVLFVIRIAFAWLKERKHTKLPYFKATISDTILETITCMKLMRSLEIIFILFMIFMPYILKIGQLCIRLLWNLATSLFDG